MKKTIASLLTAAFLTTGIAMAASPAPKATAKATKAPAMHSSMSSAKPKATPAPKATKKPLLEKTSAMASPSPKAKATKAPAMHSSMSSAKPKATPAPKATKKP
jgi:hypothetical protein